MSITNDHIKLSKVVMDYIIFKFKKDNNLKLYYMKDNKLYNCSYLDMIIASNYKKIHEYDSYYEFDVRISNIEKEDLTLKLRCCLTYKDLREFAIGKHIFGICYYNKTFNNLSSVYGIYFDDFINNRYENDNYYDIYDFNSNLFKFVNKEDFISSSRIMNTNFYLLNYKESINEL